MATALERPVIATQQGILLVKYCRTHYTSPLKPFRLQNFFFFALFFEREKSSGPSHSRKCRITWMRAVRIVQQLQNAELDYSKLNTFFFFCEERKERKGAKCGPPDRLLNQKPGLPWRERDSEALARATRELIKCSANCPEQSEPLLLPKLEPP